MSAKHLPRPARTRRQQYIIDPNLQFGVTARLLIPVAGVAMLSTAAVLLFMGRDDAALMNSQELRRFLLVANAFYFILQSSMLIVASLILTHRVAGPAWVLRHALDGMLIGDDDRRISLRDYDYLKDVGERLATLRAHLKTQRSNLDATFEELQARLAAGDVVEATRIVATLRLTGEVASRAELETPDPAVVSGAGRATAAQTL